MNASRFTSLTVLAYILLSGPVLAEKADRGKPMNIEADALRYDDGKQTSVFTGNVVLTKGTIIIRGNQLDVRQDAQGNQFGVVTAKPGTLAFFRQKRDTLPGATEEFMEGESEVIEYDSRADVVHFRRRAEVRRYVGTTLNDEINGALIVYNNTTSILTVDGGPAPVSPPGLNNRVRAVLTPRSDGTGAAPVATPPSSPAPLRRSPALGGSGR